MKDPEINQGGEQSLHFPIPDIDRYWRVRQGLENLMHRLDVRIEGSEIFDDLAKQDKGVILAPTHTSWLDIMALAAANDAHTMRFMGKEELWKVPYVGKLARDAGAFAVDRTLADSRQAALQTSVDLVENGEWVVLYPEGTRNKLKNHYTIGKVKSGVARTALATSGETPVVPIGVGYRKGLIKKKAGLFHVGLVVGDPFFIGQAEDSEYNVEAINDNLKESLFNLKKLAVDLADSK